MQSHDRFAIAFVGLTAEASLMGSANSDTTIIVPARLASRRFPRKLLHEIGAKPLILWTAERIRSVAPDFPLVFAVAESELADLLEDRGYRVVPTDPDLPSGTDRIAQANAEIRSPVVINVQADEPLVTGRQIETLARLIHEGAEMATLAVRFREESDLHDPNKVKVVRSANGEALYFSRSPIPFCRDRKGYVDGPWLAENPCFWHLGLYAYRAETIQRFTALPGGTLEQIERLEQLRMLEHGFRIAVGLSDDRNLGIDTPEDAAAFAERVGATS